MSRPAPTCGPCTCAPRQVVVPCVIDHLSTSRVLVQEFVEGVPILEAAGLEHHVRAEMMAALVMAFGVQVRWGWG